MFWTKFPSDKTFLSGSTDVYIVVNVGVKSDREYLRDILQLEGLCANEN